MPTERRPTPPPTTRLRSSIETGEAGEAGEAGDAEDAEHTGDAERTGDADVARAAGHAAESSGACCDRGSLESRELMNLPGPLAHRLARAWLSLGCGGLIVFLTYALALGHVTWSGVTLWLAVFGGWLMLRGGRVVSKEGVNLLDAAAQAALPPARVVTSRPRGDTGGH